jgi:hypothetical protein
MLLDTEHVATLGMKNSMRQVDCWSVLETMAAARFKTFRAMPLAGRISWGSATRVHPKRMSLSGREKQKLLGPMLCSQFVCFDARSHAIAATEISSEISLYQELPVDRGQLCSSFSELDRPLLRAVTYSYAVF